MISSRLLATRPPGLTASIGMRINSSVLIANAWHHRSDALSSVVALVGIGGSMLGLPFLDPLAGVLVGAMVRDCSERNSNP